MRHYEQPWAGGTVYNCLERCLQHVKQSNDNAMTTTVNDVTIVVYKESFMSDLCDKYDMQRKITYRQY
ncbi:hypothetical protein S14_183 [Shewanella sp. phage 1/4]|uniref:hypothetical protein n=1 Tax=Shewanella phage 1/4 TaxID=1458859 RepID=UPI0004F8DE39|nr:hypothetical protein S14_183 [Shewanella sp. phage 1/4]AHK11292.1 hypothetical protein S14_183 [Shewanella sp. phage 1/4]